MEYHFATSYYTVYYIIGEDIVALTMVSRNTLNILFICMALSNAQETACDEKQRAGCLDRAQTPDVDFFG